MKILCLYKNRKLCMSSLKKKKKLHSENTALHNKQEPCVCFRQFFGDVWSDCAVQSEQGTFGAKAAQKSHEHERERLETRV